MNTDRTAQVNGIIAQHVPFKNEPFQPHTITARIFTRLSLWFGRKTRLQPVAFKARIHIIECMGCTMSVGGMHAYLWLDPAKRLVGYVNSKYVLVAPDSLTDEDITNLELGIKGDSQILDDEYDRVRLDMLDSLRA
jgi:hypothetical protein